MNGSTMKIKEEIKTYLEKNENEITTQNLWDTGKAILKAILISLQVYLNKQGEVQINKLTLCLKKKNKQSSK